MEDVKTETTKNVKSENNYMQYLTFLLGNELYGFEVKNIREVIEYNQITSITEIPMVPEYIKGVINLRGEVVPVVDLSSRFYGYRSDITRRTCISIIEVEDDSDTVLVGSMIDAVNAVIDMSLDDIETTMGFGAKIRSDFIKGIGKADDKFIILLNLDKVLDIDDLSSFEDFDEDSSALLLSSNNNIL